MSVPRLLEPQLSSHVITERSLISSQVRVRSFITNTRPCVAADCVSTGCVEKLLRLVDFNASQYSRLKQHVTVTKLHVPVPAGDVRSATTHASALFAVAAVTPAPYNNALLQTLTVTQLVQNYPAFYGACSGPLSAQHLATGSCLHSDESNSHTNPTSLTYSSILPVHL